MDFLAALIKQIDAPDLMLAFLVLFFAWSAVKAQQLKIVDWGEGLRDVNNKVSYMRLGVIVSLFAMTWVLIALTVDAVSHQDDLDELFKWYLLYALVWSGAPTANKLLELIGLRWGATAQKLGDTPPATTPTVSAPAPASTP